MVGITPIEFMRILTMVDGVVLGDTEDIMGIQSSIIMDILQITAPDRLGLAVEEFVHAQAVDMRPTKMIN